MPGYLLNQFSLSENGGYLRVASTSRPIWWGPVLPTTSQSYVTVLQPQGGVLAPVGQVSGLGQGEQIYSVRFVGNTGYVVTFHQVDPLYTIDLSTPTAPKVVGELELQGYSAYLHPLTDGLLLGIGQDVSTTTNEPTGAQLELFDVADPASPKLLAKTSLGTGSSSQATYDHHAFLYWAATNLVVLPVQVYSYQVVTPGIVSSSPAQAPFTGAYAFRVTRAGIQQLAQLVQDQVNGSAPPIERAIVVGEPPLHRLERGRHGLGPRHACAAGVRLVRRLTPGRGPTGIRERGRMAELRVPDSEDSQFREYYRELISESVRRSAEQSGEPHLRSSVRMVWIAAVVLLVADLLAFGVHSWTTSVADIGLILATLVWFWVCIDDLIE